ncbi:MFS transporter [Nonomuraea sp. NPDC003804]|uniref:MFS transporter n=1 Tax=Nonomuraea sp. NPDC003804 TaxID=3154547 RepID=UPI0033B4810B
MNTGTTDRRWRLVPPGYRPVLRNRRFMRLLPGLLISRFGDGMGGVALTWLALELAPADQRGQVVGLALAAYVLPGALSGLLLGRWCARLDSRTLLITDALLRAALLSSVMVLHRFDALSAFGYIGILALSSLFHTWGMGARTAVVAELVDEEEDRRAANSLLYSGGQLSLILGPAVAGLLATAIGPDAVLATNGLCFLVLAVSLVGFPRLGRPPAEEAEGLGSMLPGLRALFGNVRVATLIVMTFVVAVIATPVDVALPVYVADILGGSASTLGLFWTLYGVGGLVGAILGGALRRIPLWPATIAIAFGCGAAVLPLGLTAMFLPALIGFAISGFVFAPYPALSTTLLQQSIPAAAMVAAGTAWSSMILVAEPIGSALGGVMVQRLGPQPTILISAFAMMGVALLACLPSLLSRLLRRPQPVGAPDA